MYYFEDMMKSAIPKLCANLNCIAQATHDVRTIIKVKDLPILVWTGVCDDCYKQLEKYNMADNMRSQQGGGKVSLYLTELKVKTALELIDNAIDFNSREHSMKLTERELIRAKGILLEIINRPIKETDNG